MNLILILIFAYFWNIKSIKGRQCCHGGEKIQPFETFGEEAIDGQHSPPSSKLLLKAPEARILSNEPDSLITCVTNFVLSKGEKVKEKCLVVKDVFSIGYFEDKGVDKSKKMELKKMWGKWTRKIVNLLEHIPNVNIYRKIAKPMFMLRHELNIFRLWSAEEGGIIPIVRLVESALRKHSVLMIMELGTPLPEYLKNKREEWAKMTAEKLNIEIMEMIVQIAKTLKEFHKKAMHLHLKPGNWVYVERENGKRELKLIDFQTSLQFNRLKELIPDYGQNDQQEMKTQSTFNYSSEYGNIYELKSNLVQITKELNGKNGNMELGGNGDGPESLEEMVEFLCNSLWNERGLPKLTGAIWANQRPSTYASPEHKEACNQIYENRQKSDKHEGELAEQLKRITVKSDIWAVGILIVEILGQTPKLMERAKIISNRTKLLGIGKEKGKLKMAENFVVLRDYFVNGGQKMRHEEQRKIANELGREVDGNFPQIYGLLKKIFVYNKMKRPTLDEIIEKMEKGLAELGIK